MAPSPTLQRYVIYTGGFLGPFSGQALGVILPEFGASFGLGVNQAALTLTVYLLPFALVMLFSTNLIRTLSPSSVIYWAYAVTLACAVVLIATPWWWLFLVAYGIMGIANAFTTPVLQIVLKRITPAGELGGALGTYTAMQSLGILCAPFIAGLAAGVSWRLIFVLTLLGVLFVLLVKVPHVPAQPRTAARAEAIDWPVISAKMVGCYAIGVSVIGLAFIVALQAGNRFDLSPAARGLVVMCGGLASFIFSRQLGRKTDALGAGKMVILSLAVAALCTGLIPLLPSVWLLAPVWGITVLAAQTAQTSINMETLRARGGERVLSTVQAFRYFGSSSTPIIMLPLFNLYPVWGFGAAAAVILLALLAQLPGLRRGHA